jgi:hypothetical protein
VKENTFGGSKTLKLVDLGVGNYGLNCLDVKPDCMQFRSKCLFCAKKKPPGEHFGISVVSTYSLEQKNITSKHSVILGWHFSDQARSDSANSQVTFVMSLLTVGFGTEQKVLQACDG